MKPHYTDIEAFLRANFDCTIYKGDWGDPFPDITWEYVTDTMGRKYYQSNGIKYDWIFSFLCPWKIPKEVLSLAKKGAINFHPGPPKYPGIGCYNYAIWNDDEEYGVTCHLMDGELDHGKIINVLYFKLNGNETVNTLKNKSIVNLKLLFYDVMDAILDEEEVIIVDSYFKWGEYKSKKDFENFCNLSGRIFGHNLDFTLRDDLVRKLRATYYPGATEGPYITIDGKKWRLVPY